MRVRLEGISLKGKNKVKEHGEIWNVIEINPSVAILGGKLGYLLQSLCNTLKVGDSRVKDLRWVAANDDENFKVSLVDSNIGVV